MHDMVLNNRDTILHDLYLLNSPFAVDAFKPAISIILGEEHQTFKLKMLHNWISYDYKLEREDSTWGYAKTLSSSTQKQFTRISCLQKGISETENSEAKAMRKRSICVKASMCWVGLSLNAVGQKPDKKEGSQGNPSLPFVLFSSQPLKGVSGCMIANLACQVHKWEVGKVKGINGKGFGRDGSG
ncbi:hypothetical protein Tco_0567574 [Tanacetum coccineum]